MFYFPHDCPRTLLVVEACGVIQLQGTGQLVRRWSITEKGGDAPSPPCPCSLILRGNVGTPTKHFAFKRQAKKDSFGY